MQQANNQQSVEQREIKLWQTTDAVKYFRSLLFIFLYFVSITLAFYFSSPNYFASGMVLWGIFSAIFILLGLVINYIIIAESGLSTKARSSFMYATSLLAGIMVAVGMNGLDMSMIANNPSLHILVLTCAFMLYASTQFAALFYLTQRYSYFLLFIVPTFIPALQLYFLDISLLQKLFCFLFISTYFVTVIYIGYLMSRERLTGFNKEIASKRFFLKQVNIEAENSQLKEELEKLRQEYHTTTTALLHQQQQFDVLQNNFTYTSQVLSYENHIQRESLSIIQRTHHMLSWHWDLKSQNITTSALQHLFGEAYAQDKTLDDVYLSIHPEDKIMIQNALIDHIRGNTAQYDVTYRFKKDKQDYMWIRDTGRVTRRDADTHRAVEMVGVSYDVTREYQRNEWFKLSKKLFDHAAQGFFALNKSLCFVNINPYFLNLLQLKEEQVIHQHLFKIIRNNGVDASQFSSDILNHLSNDSFFEGEFVYPTANKEQLTVWTHISAIYDEKGEISHYVGILNDLTNYKSSEQQLTYLQSYDTVTDLPNRTYFNEQIQSEIESHSKHNKQFALVRINLDRFRHYNELLSQQGADELLHQVAGRLRQLTEEENLLSRLNADDFVMLMDSQGDKAQLVDQCKAVMKAVKKPFKINGHEFNLTLSIGISIFPEHGRHADLLNYHAELALMDAKRIGGSSIRIYQDEKSLSTTDRTILENDLRRAVENRELSVFFQPKLNLQSRDIDSFEALIRWKHPKLGLIPPSQFIPIAEESSLISDIGTLVMDATCRQIRRWSLAGYHHVSVSVNIVAQQLQRGNLINEIDYLLKKYNIEPKQLELEITETSLMDDTQDVKLIMLELQQRGLRIAVDDFGTGYSSLSYLAQYPFDIIKIDRSFISKIGTHQQDAIIKAIIAMAKAMKKQVVAEGVESKEQFLFLENEGCDYLQGYFIGKAVEVDEATTLLGSSESLIKKYSNISH
ncbi:MULTISPECIES: EAL domain-containing protein [unclassified Acinetobacter]|uniref:EAL domain-containing protein n=1 Tax=unclassified Acinetobacter TaxID=196816 RepID=UPI0035B7DD3F